jgi:hypothetical protein
MAMAVILDFISAHLSYPIMDTVIPIIPIPITRLPSYRFRPNRQPIYNRHPRRMSSLIKPHIGTIAIIQKAIILMLRTARPDGKQLNPLPTNKVAHHET